LSICKKATTLRTAYKKRHHSAPEVRTYGDECSMRPSVKDRDLARNRCRRSNMVGRASALLQPVLFRLRRRRRPLCCTVRSGGRGEWTRRGLSSWREHKADIVAVNATATATAATTVTIPQSVCQRHIRQRWPAQDVRSHIIYYAERQHISTNLKTYRYRAHTNETALKIENFITVY